MISIKSKIHGNKVDAEIDEYGDLSSFATSGIGWEARVHKNKTEKEMERDEYQYTGIQQLGTSYPNPYTRDQLIKLKFGNSTIFQSSIVSIVVTIFAIIIDMICYILLIQGSVGIDTDLGVQDYLPALGAAIAIDFIPLFLAQNLHRLNVSKKTVLKSFNIFSLVVIITILSIILMYRILQITQPEQSDIISVSWAVLMIIIPIATTMTCFIVSYISYNPLREELKRLKNQELYIQENIYEINAMLEEADSIPNYKENLIKQDDALYDSAYDLIGTIGEYYRSYIRTEIIPMLHSPADTTDLTVDRNIKSVQKIDLPIYNPIVGDDI